jgi:hypothetical protein
MNIKLEELIKLEACSSGLNRFKSLNLEVATLEQTLSVCTVSDVLWYLGQDQSNFSNIVLFAKWCAEEAKEYADATKAARFTAYAGYDAYAAANAAANATDAIYAAKFAIDAARSARSARYAANEAAAEAVREKQKAKLLELFS